MTDTWRCHQCGKPVPAECDGACGQGTTAGRPSQDQPARDEDRSGGDR